VDTSIRKGLGIQGYALPDDGDGQDGAAALAGMEAMPAPVALPRDGDGRVADVSSAAAIAVTQPVWGWGLAPAVGREPVDGLLTDLETDAGGYCARQQTAVRRDQGERLGDYGRYEPRAFV